MRRLFSILPVITIAVLSVGCTHNNGDIGDWFGTWRLEAIAVDGAPDAGYECDVLWKFQNNIIEMVRVNDVDHSYDQRFGTWSRSGNILVLNFGHHDNVYGPGEGRYAPLEGLYLQPGETELNILELSGSELRLSYRDSEEVTVIYNLKKWG